MTEDDEYTEDIELVADTRAFAALLVKSTLDDPEDALGPVATKLLSSLMGDVVKDLPETPQDALQVVIDRLERPIRVLGIVTHVAGQTIRGAREAGIDVNLDGLRSPYDALLDLDDPDEP